MPRPPHRKALREGSAATETIYAIPDAAEQPNISDSNDVGIPKEARWDLVNTVYSARFCFDHGENEWLLLYADRWMRPSDFSVHEAKTKLETKLRQYQNEPWTPKLHLPTSRVECDRPLWSHLDTPTQRGKLGDEDIYLCRWKLCWTSEKDVDDKDWAQACLKTQYQRSGRRRSARVEKTAAHRVTKMEQMMRVIKLETLL